MAGRRPGGARGRLFVFSGPSGAGKGTVVKEILRRRPGLQLSVSVTTRPARAGERSGLDYRFVAPREFLAMRDRGDLLEWAEVYGHLYGTPRDAVERALESGRDVVCELDIQGALSIKRAKPEAILIFVEPPSFDELSKRLRGRGTEDAEAMTRRLRAGYEEIKQKGRYDHIVVNERLDRAVEDVLRILDARE